MSRLKQVKFPLFEECAKLEKIGFWRKMFLNCAYGKFPKGVIFKDNALMYKKTRRATPMLWYVQETIEETLDLYKRVFRDIIGLVSMDELLETQIACEQYIRDKILLPNDIEWRSITSPLSKARMINLHVQREQKRLGLSDCSRDQLYTTIMVGLSTGDIPSNAVTIVDYQVVNIEGVHRKGARWYVKSASDDDFTSPPETKKQKQQDILVPWNTWVEKYNAVISRSAL
jgi:hypothetical protein